MANCIYVSNEIVKTFKQTAKELIYKVQQDLRKYFTFRFDFIGSSKYNLVTYNKETDDKPDLDCDIQINDDENQYEPNEIIEYLINSFNKYLSCFGFFKCIQHKRTFSIYGSKFSIDFAVVNYYYEDDSLNCQYINYNHKTQQYSWELNTLTYVMIKDRIDVIKRNRKWTYVRDYYLYLKNTNTNPYKKSRSLFLEVINNIYHEITQNNDDTNEEYEYDEQYYDDYYDDD